MGSNPCRGLLLRGIAHPVAEPSFQVQGVYRETACKTRENSNFLKNGKIVISVKIRNFSKSRMTKLTLPLESSREI